MKKINNIAILHGLALNVVVILLFLIGALVYSA